MIGEDMFQYLPQILAVLIDKAGGTIELSDKDAERIHNMGTVELEFWKTDMFTGPFVKIRYNEVVNIQSETVPTSDRLMGILGEITQQRAEATARDLLGVCPDFTGGLSVDEYMDEQRGRGTE